MNFYLIIFLFLYSGTKSKAQRVPSLNAMPQKLHGKWETECLNAEFPLLTSAISRIQREVKKNIQNLSTNTINQ